MSTTLYDAAVSLVAVGGLLSMLASTAFLISALIGWRTPSRNRRLAWFALLAVAPVITAAIHYGMLGWVYGTETEPARQRRITSGIAMSLVPAVALLTAAWRGRSSGRGSLTRFALVAAIPFVLAAFHSFMLFRVHLPAIARQMKLENRNRVGAAALIHTGDAAPQFRLTTDGGIAFDLSEHRGRVVLINFFATWCGPCLLELPLVQETWNEHRDRRDFALLVIGRDETSESVAAFREQHQFTFPMAADPRNEFFSLFASESIPRTFLIGRDGKVRLSLTGFDREEFEELRRVLNEELERSQ